MKHSYDKSKFLEILRENPWIVFASKKSGISRATIYRWMKDNPDFQHEVEIATKAGNSQLGEIAEMGLVKNIKEGNLNAIKFYLTNTNPRYVSKRSEYILPPEHHHYDNPDRCELCGRLSVLKDAEIREKFKKMEKEIKELSNDKTDSGKNKVDTLIRSVLKNSQKNRKKIN